MTGVSLDPVKPVPDAALSEDALRRAVLAALADHPAEAATVTEGRHERDSAMWGMEVETADPAAASVHVTFTGGDEVVVGFGQTHAYLWDDDPTALAAYLRAVLDAVFAGDFEEAGLGDAFARVQLHGGTTVRLGNMHRSGPLRTWALTTLHLVEAFRIRCLVAADLRGPRPVSPVSQALPARRHHHAEVRTPRSGASS